jgi:ATPase subunit of ABC transporter with duplicated ATPase domains
MLDFIEIHNLSFSYENSQEELFDTLPFQLHRGWTGVVGANGSGKTTLLQLMCGNLKSDSGTYNIPSSAYYCEQRTDYMPSGFEEFLNTTEKAIFRIKTTLQIQDDWKDRWDTLSHGERKRCQIAISLFKNPSLLAIDEPSNHLDHKSKNYLFTALRSYNGIGLLVSHDRELLDNLCRHTLFIFPPHIDVRKCNYSVALAEIERENEHKILRYQIKKQEIKKLKRKFIQHRENAKQAHKLKSKRQLNPKDHDEKSKKDLARLTGKDGVEGKIQRRLKTRLKKSENHLKSIEFKKSTPLGILFNEKKVIKTFPLIIQAKEIGLGKNKRLRSPEICIQYGDKIGIIGDNGCGKSTFLNDLTATINLEQDQIIYIPQEIPIEQSKRIVERIQAYNSEKKGKIMTVISRLGSAPEHVLETTIPTPGEVRKLMLAEGIMLNPSIIIMDEPTNHMDLPSMQCIEKALIECPCAQLLVSHDHIFLNKIVTIWWSFTEMGKDKYSIIEKHTN